MSKRLTPSFPLTLELFMKKLIALTVGAGFALGAAATPENYIIDNNHTFARFEYSHFGLSRQVSHFDKTSGTITLDRAARTGAVEVSIDATSVNTGNGELNKHIQDADFFDTKKYPAITFKSTKMHFKGDVPASVDGNLTVKGVTKPVTLDIATLKCMPHPMLKKEACGANATTTIRRSDFNAGKYAPGVSDDVTLSIAVEAVKQ